MADKDILEFAQSLKNINDADSKDENERNNATPIPTSSEMRSVRKNMHTYLEANSNVEMNNKIGDIEQFDAKKTMQRKIPNYFPKTINALFSKIKFL
ncbi:hypothetical protein TNCV_1267031 [Trichonephila clavipes]|nr:hypothetical protein TNCV_1267031 [Trichonephila clavipes]